MPFECPTGGSSPLAGLVASKSRCSTSMATARRFCASGPFAGVPVFVSRSTNYLLTSGMKYVDVQLLTGQHLYVAVDGTDMLGQPSVILYLRVHTYVDAVRIISCPIALLHYYMQLRENLRVYWSPEWVREEQCYEATALALQADFGDYNENTAAGTVYFSPELYFPSWVVEYRGVHFLRRHTPTVHRDCQGMDPQEARYRFCEELSTGLSAVNVHLYRLKRTKSEQFDSILLGIGPAGIDVFEPKQDNPRALLDGKIAQKQCSIYGVIDGTTATSNGETSIQSSDGKITSNGCDKIFPNLSNATGQRVSLVSDASSNTTSGIVSDKQQAPDDSENDNGELCHRQDRLNIPVNARSLSDPDLLEFDFSANGKVPLVHSDSARSEVSFVSRQTYADEEETSSTDGSGEVGEFCSTSQAVCSCAESVAADTTDRNNTKLKTASSNNSNNVEPVHCAVKNSAQIQHPILPSALATLEEKLRRCQLRTREQLALNVKNSLVDISDIRRRTLFNNADCQPTADRNCNLAQRAYMNWIPTGGMGSNKLASASAGTSSGGGCSSHFLHGSAIVSRTQSLQDSTSSYRHGGALGSGREISFSRLRAKHAVNLGLGQAVSISSSELLPSTIANRYQDSGCSSTSTHYCDACQEEHCEMPAIDLDRVKSMIQAQAADLPLIRALCSDQSLHSSSANCCSISELDSTGSSAAGQWSVPVSRRLSMAGNLDDDITGEYCCQEAMTADQQAAVSQFGTFEPPITGRPLSWHESFVQQQKKHRHLQLQKPPPTPPPQTTKATETVEVASASVSDCGSVSSLLQCQFLMPPPPPYHGDTSSSSSSCHLSLQKLHENSINDCYAGASSTAQMHVSLAPASLQSVVR
ncbi:FERM domain-containing protein 1 [Trichinella spiralis]|uniref:FERM domain-containing protein 6 n=1 Tax=Trichinella spiralis TaxID=6334 RepID=E5S7S0_TRISP|nr:FERM domain-containing protein 1 [Trichinella spiralis]KRY37334.1 FERM domain-containing protein 6 [Trichinella spiralis]